ncbi:hypothetical protein BCV71DRAFT_233583 [Rhizopus microsporus]|uniref:Uncharacterized protein n=1 Tax=Rhizopus microsporus TaxID=58291 RepID=A0A1X0S6Q2_RHIZD|nr:hypothetical protein BCV71DRAFT_233583 [Rhizopus microsporus]
MSFSERPSETTLSPQLLRQWLYKNTFFLILRHNHRCQACLSSTIGVIPKPVDTSPIVMSFKQVYLKVSNHVFYKTWVITYDSYRITLITNVHFCFHAPFLAEGDYRNRVTKLYFLNSHDLNEYLDEAGKFFFLSTTLLIWPYGNYDLVNTGVVLTGTVKTEEVCPIKNVVYVSQFESTRSSS